MKKDASRWLKVLEKAHMINEIFKHFNNHEWIFDSQKTLTLFNYLTEEEKNIFQLDVTVINWREYLMHFNYGLQKYLLKENVDPPGDPQATDLFSLWNYNYFSDIKWARSQGQPFATKQKREHISLVMNS
jgi:alcohol-forming fatty acyl-CoA reductase